jgi:outer membrane lipoprotein carrier protein
LKTLFVALALSLTIPLHAAELDRAAAALAGNEARFTQQFTPKGFKTAQVESGTVVFGTLPMMRWSYSRPDEKLFVFDGQRSWFYVPSDKQVTVTNLDAQRRSELPFLLIGDPGARDKNFVVRETPSGGSTVVTLQPRSASGMIRGVVVVIASATHLIQKVNYTDREGNQTTFELSGMHKRALSNDLFHFTPPAGVQVVEQ